MESQFDTLMEFDNSPQSTSPSSPVKNIAKNNHNDFDPFSNDDIMTSNNGELLDFTIDTKVQNGHNTTSHHTTLTTGSNDPFADDPFFTSDINNSSSGGGANFSTDLLADFTGSTTTTSTTDQYHHGDDILTPESPQDRFEVKEVPRTYKEPEVLVYVPEDEQEDDEEEEQTNVPHDSDVVYHRRQHNEPDVLVYVPEDGSKREPNVIVYQPEPEPLDSQHEVLVYHPEEEENEEETKENVLVYVPEDEIDDNRHHRHDDDDEERDVLVYVPEDEQIEDARSPASKPTHLDYHRDYQQSGGLEADTEKDIIKFEPESPDAEDMRIPGDTVTTVTETRTEEFIENGDRVVEIVKHTSTTEEQISPDDQQYEYPSEEEVAEMEAKKVAKEPPKVKEKSQYTKTEPEKKDIDKVVEKGASEKPEKKKFVIEEQEYQPPKRENFKETMENNSKESSKALPVQIQNENGDCDEEPLVLMPISERMQLYQKLTSLAQSPTIHHIDKPVQWTVAALNSENMCCVCNKRVYALERLTANKNTYHKDCFKCTKCRRKLLAGDFSVNEGKLFCKPHFMELFRLRGHYEDRYKGKENIPQQQNSTIVVNNQRLKDGEPDENEEITKEDDKQDDGIDTVPNLKNIRSMFESGQDQNTNEKVRAPSAKMRTGWTPSDNTVERSPSPERDPSIIRNEKQDPEHKNKIEYEDATERSPSPDIPRDPNVVRSDSIVEENMPPKDLAKGLVARFRQMESEQVHTAPPMPTRSPKLHARNQQQQQPAKPTGPPEPRMDLIDQARRASDVRTEWAMENAPEGGEFENNPEQRPDVIRESDPNQTEVLPEIGTTKSRLAIFKEIEQTGGVPSPQVGDSYKKRSPPPMKEIPASADHNGELESQPVVRTDVVRESDQFDDGLPPPQMARNIRDMFQNMGSQEQKKEEKRQTTNKQYGSPTVPKRYGGSVNSPVVAQSASQRYAQPPGSPNLIPKSPSSYRSGAVGSTPPKSPATTIRQPVLKKPESPKPFVYESRSQYKEFTPPRESPARNITSKEVLENEPEQHKPEVIRCDELWDDSEELPPPDLTRGMLAKFREMEQKHKDEREKSPVTVRRPRGEWGTTVTYKKGEPQAPVNGTDQLDMSPEGGEYENNPEVRSDVIREADTNDVDVMPQSGTTRSLLAKFQA